ALRPEESIQMILSVAEEMK
ncbi:hypothetical protein, partial [Frankia casuarinae]